MSQDQTQEQVNVTEVPDAEQATSSAVTERISKKTGKPVRAPNAYQKFMSEKLKEKSEDGKRKFTMQEASLLWKEHKSVPQN